MCPGLGALVVGAGFAAAHGLDVAAQALGVKPFHLRAAGGARGAARFGHLAGLLQKLVQAAESLHAVHVLAAVVLCLDDHHPGAGDARIGQGQHALLHLIGQRRGLNVKAQMDGARDLVDVLPARTLGPHRSDGDFGFVNEQGHGLR